jgi:hypothetical protein
MFEGFEIFVGIDERLRNMPNHTDGMLLAGDAAGLESTGLCDGVPCAWFSADMAADVAMEAIAAGDTSAAFLRRYDDRIRAHPIIQWAITCVGRWNLRRAQESHARKDLRSRVHYQFGFGILTHAGTPLIKCALRSVREDPSVVAKWVRMFLRYYYNWEHERFGSGDARVTGGRKGALWLGLKLLDAALWVFGPLLRTEAAILEPLSGAVNPLVRVLRPVLEPALHAIVRMERVLGPLTRGITGSVAKADPTLFESR